jgi:hypothetical protein
MRNKVATPKKYSKSKASFGATWCMETISKYVILTKLHVNNYLCKKYFQ